MSPVFVAAFPDRERAREAVRALHDEGFRDHWVGVTNASGTTETSDEVRVEEPNLFERMGRFFHGESNESLHEALVRRGVDEAQAQRIDRTAPANSAIVTLSGSNHPDYALDLISQYGGRLLSNGTPGLSDNYQDRLGESDVLASQRRTGFVGDDDNAEQQRIRLREERLNISKETVSAGEAVVRKTTEVREQSVDVPVYHEEFFIERRPVTDGRLANTAPIGGEEQVVRVPLTQERVEVTKRPVVVEEAIVGKRRVEETQHVSETTRRERLVTDGDRELPDRTLSDRDVSDRNATRERELAYNQAEEREAELLDDPLRRPRL